jgi:hypothetical protein
MSLRGFLDACYALLVEDFQRVNPLLPADDVLERVRSALGMNAGPDPAPTAVAAPAGVTVNPAQNDRSMNMLMAMMGGVKGSPV